jgi:hypothetical protein
LRLNDTAKAEAEIGNVMKGWRVLESRACDNGLAALDASVIATLYHGREVYICAGPAEAFDVARRELPEDARVVHIGELLAAYDIVAERAGLEGIKKAFPGARVVAPMKPEGDSVPF